MRLLLGVSDLFLNPPPRLRIDLDADPESSSESALEDLRGWKQSRAKSVITGTQIKGSDKKGKLFFVQQDHFFCVTCSSPLFLFLWYSNRVVPVAFGSINETWNDGIVSLRSRFLCWFGPWIATFEPVQHSWILEFWILVKMNEFSSTYTTISLGVRLWIYSLDLWLQSVGWTYFWDSSWAMCCRTRVPVCTSPLWSTLKVDPLCMCDRWLN